MAAAYQTQDRPYTQTTSSKPYATTEGISEINALAAAVVDHQREQSTLIEERQCGQSGALYCCAISAILDVADLRARGVLLS